MASNPTTIPHPAGGDTGPTPSSGRGLRWSRVRGGWRGLRQWALTVDEGTFVVAATGAAAALRVPRLGISYWGDEAISVGIASHSLHQIPGFLRFDGSPPLYYALLHYWIAVWGTSAVATHTLSLIISLLAVPTAWWCGRALFGPGAGRPAALLAAVCPYLTYYGTETRMYALVAVAAMPAVTGMVRALRAPPPGGGGGVWRRFRSDPALGWLAVAAGSTLVVLYTHNWGLFLLAALVTVGVVVAWRQGLGRRAGAGGSGSLALRRSAIYAVAVAAGYAPWIPSFIWQLRSTGAPWAPHPGVLSIVLDPLDAVFNATAFSVETMRLGLGPGGRLDPLYLLPWVAVVGGIAAVAARRWSRLGTGARGRAHLPEAGPDSRPRLALAGAAVVASIMVAWVTSQVVHAWASRYLGIAVGPLLLVAAGAACCYRWARKLLPLLAAAMTISAIPVLLDPPAAASTKSNVAAVDAAMGPRLVRGDLVVSTALSEVPLIAYYLPSGLRYASPLGPVNDPSVVDWVDLTGRLAAADPSATLSRLLSSVPLGGKVLLINPLSWAQTETPARYKGVVTAEGIAVNQELLNDPHLTVVKTVSPPHPSAVANPVEGVLLVRNS